jgi:O-6-methylguanine DNA methyltransferase
LLRAQTACSLRSKQRNGCHGQLSSYDSASAGNHVELIKPVSRKALTCPQSIFVRCSLPCIDVQDSLHESAQPSVCGFLLRMYVSWSAVKGQFESILVTTRCNAERAGNFRTLQQPHLQQLKTAMAKSQVVTKYQERVYTALQQIPEGKITSYAAMAKALGSSPRAVGGALRINPFAPEIPCHRCIASTGVRCNGPMNHGKC